MSVFNRTAELKQWERLVQFLGLDITVIESSAWLRARSYEVLPDLNAIYSIQLTSNIMRKLQYFNHRLSLGLDCCNDKNFCHKDLAELDMEEILAISNKTMLAIHTAYGDLEKLLEYVSRKKISSFDIDGRATQLEKVNTTNTDWDWHGMALLELIKEHAAEKLDIPSNEVEVCMYSIGGYLFIKNRAVATIDSYDQLAHYVEMVERAH